MAVFVISGWWWRSRQAPDYDDQALSVRQAHERAMAGDIVLIDIRTPQEWRQTGIAEGARPIDMRRDDFLAALRGAAGPDPAAPIALICARGVRSARLSLQLSAAGYGNIMDVPEGMLGSRAGPGWLASGLPVQPYEKASQ
ncbi:rhodanese-like domain-containing protein [Seohaeicola saemankumensis]|nr:rhodanese-like domain-containing protein [Seohaeicola saemankumensis]